MERRDLPHMDNLPAWFLNMGYTMKVEPVVDVIERIEFCQSQPVFDGEQYIMTRIPKAALSKDLICIKNVDTEGAWKYQCQAISDCGLAAYGNMPIYWQFYNMLNVGGKHRRKDQRPEDGLQWMAQGMDSTRGEPHPDSRVSFWRAFGITPDAQVALEHEYSSAVAVYRPGPNVRISTLYTNEIFNHSQFPDIFLPVKNGRRSLCRRLRC
jgi:hypothetical protein